MVAESGLALLCQYQPTSEYCPALADMTRQAYNVLMISDLDIWRAAQVMSKRYGKDAATEAAMRADEFQVQGSIDGQRVWMRIMQAIEELQRERPRDGEATH